MFGLIAKRPLVSFGILVLSAVALLLLHYVAGLSWIPSLMLAPAGSAVLLIWILQDLA